MFAFEIKLCARLKFPSKFKLTVVPFGSDPAGTLTETLLPEFEPENDMSIKLDALSVPISVKSDGEIPESDNCVHCA